MRFLLPCFFALLSCGLLKGQDAWKTTAIDSMLTVEGPGEFGRDMQEGHLMHSCPSETSVLSYVDEVNSTVYSREELKRFYDTLQAGAISESHGKLIDSRQVYVGNDEARYFVVEGTNQSGEPYHFETEVLLIGHRNFCFIRSSTISTTVEDEEAGQRFFNSIKLTEKGKKAAQLGTMLPPVKSPFENGFRIGFMIGEILMIAALCGVVFYFVGRKKKKL